MYIHLSVFKKKNQYNRQFEESYKKNQDKHKKKNPIKILEVIKFSENSCIILLIIN